MEFLNKTYFYDQYGKREQKVAISGNCFTQLCAIIYQNLEQEVKIGCGTLWLNSLLFNIKVKNGLPIRSCIRNKNTGTEKEVYDTSSVLIEGNEDLAEELMSKMLRERGMVIFRTIDKMLPISKYYDPTFSDLSKFPAMGHVMLMVGEDRNYYYFVDQLNEINKDYCKTADGRKDIFRWPKTEMKKLFGIYLKFILVDFNNMENSKLVKNNYSIIRDSVKGYFEGHNNAREENDVLIFENRAALRWIRKFFDRNDLKLNKRVYRYPQGIETDVTIKDEMINGITGIVNNRMLLIKFLQEIGWNKDIDSIVNSIEAWNQWKLFMMANYKKEKYELDGKYSAFIDNVFDAEEEMFETLKIWFD